MNHIIRCKKCKKKVHALLGQVTCSGKCNWVFEALILPLSGLNAYAYCSCGSPIGAKQTSSGVKPKVPKNNRRKKAHTKGVERTMKKNVLGVMEKLKARFIP